MTDISRNPEERAAMERLDAKLAGIESELAAQRRQGEQLLARDQEARGQARRDQTRASREGRVRGRAGDVTPEERIPLQREETRLTQQTTRAADTRLQAERRVSSELRQRIALEREAARQARLPVPITPGSPGSVIRAQGYAVQTAQRAQAERQASIQDNVERERLRQFVANEYSFRRALPPSRQLPAGGGTGGGAGGGLPPVGGAPPPPGGGPPRRDYVRDALEREKLTASDRALAEQALRARSAEGALDSEIQQATRNIGLSSQGLRRHGALTTEFIQAAAKGQVTFRELGFQVGSTIAKFAGWTAAATAVYGAARAIGELGKGARDSASGVQGLTRFIPNLNREGAQVGFEKTSRDLNVPIGDVAGAQQSFARVFHNQADALAAARVSIQAYKLDNIDAAASQRFFTGIIQEWGLSAQRLPSLFDQISAAQRRMGARVSELLPALARSGAAVRNTGGDLNQLIALLATTQVATGQTGNVVGTAFYRGASNFYRRPTSVPVEKGYGLDPSKGFTQFLIDAIQRAQTLNGGQRRDLALAIFGPQYGGRVGQSLLNQSDRVSKALNLTSPQKAAGSAAEELHDKLRQVDERIKRIGVDLQIMGSVLARVGAFNVLGQGLDVLDKMLSVTGQLIGGFHDLSFGADKFLVPLLEVYGVLRLMRRFDLGGVLPKGREGGVYENLRGSTLLRGSEDYRLNKQILQGTGDQQRFLEDLRAQRARETGTATFAAQRALVRRDETRGAYFAGQLPVKDVAAAQRTVNSQLEQAARLSADEAAIVEQQNALKAQILEYERLRSAGLSAQVAATRAGIEYAPGGLDRPVAERAKRIEDLRAAEQGRGPIPTGAAGAGAGAAAAGAEAEAAGISRLQARSAQFRTRTQQLAERMRSLGVAGQALAAVTTAGAGAATGAASGAAKAAGGVKNMAGQVLASLGPLDVLLLGLFAAYESYHHITQQLAANQEKIAKLSQPAADPVVLADRARQLRDHSPFESIQSAFADTYNFLRGPNSVLPGAQSPAQQRDEIAKHLDRERAGLAKAQSRGRLLPLGEIAVQYRNRASQAQNDGQALTAIDNEIDQIKNGYANAFGGKQAKQAAQEALAAAQAKRRDLLAASDDIDKVQQAISSIADAKGLETFTKDTGARFGLYGGSQANFRRSSLAIAQARELIANRRISPADGLQAIQQLQQDAQKAAEDQLNRLLPYATSPQAAGRLRATYVSRMRQVYVGATARRVQSLSNSVRDRQKQIDAIQREVDKGPGPHEPRADQQQTIQGEAAKRAQLAQLKIAQGKDRDTLRKLRQQLGLSRQEFEAIRREQQRAQFEAEQAVYDARTELGAAKIADPIGQLRYELGRNEQNLARVAREYGRGSQQYIQALTKSAQYRAQLVQAEIGRFQQRQELATATFSIGTTQGQQLQYAVGQAQQFVSYLQGLGKKVDPGTMLQALTAVANARAQLAEFVRQQAQELVSARSEYLQSLTEDPVRQAYLKFQEQQQLLQFARTPAERFKAQAAINNARRDYRQTRQREAYDEIEFETDMGKITAQTELQRLQMLLKTIKGNRDLRREIQRRIYQLQHSDTNLSDLDVGSIKLPTLYDIRRAVKGGLNSPRSVQVTNAPQIQLNVQPGSEGRVGDVLDSTLGTSTRSAMRAAGIST